jgi:hypothetical protein
MIKNIPLTATLLISGLVFLFTVGIAIYALNAPYMKYSIGNSTIDVYFEKMCKNGECQNLEDSIFREWVSIGKALQALYIVLVILAGVCFLLYVFNQKRIFNIASLLLLAVALATMITLIIVVQTSKMFDNTMEFTSASILIIIACCFMIVKQLFANDYIRNALGKVFSMIRKK